MLQPIVKSRYTMESVRPQRVEYARVLNASGSLSHGNSIELRDHAFRHVVLCALCAYCNNTVASRFEANSFDCKRAVPRRMLEGQVVAVNLTNGFGKQVVDCPNEMHLSILEG